VGQAKNAATAAFTSVQIRRQLDVARRRRRPPRPLRIRPCRDAATLRRRV